MIGTLWDCQRLELLLELAREANGALFQESETCCDVSWEIVGTFHWSLSLHEREV